MQPSGDVVSTPLPGWYPASDQPGLLRYWDGEAWTAHTAPLPPTAYAIPGAWTRPAPQTNSLAIASLVCGVVGFSMCGVPSVVGIVLGHMARRQIRASEGRETGEGIALAGLIACYATILFALALVALWLAALGWAFDEP